MAGLKVYIILLRCVLIGIILKKNIVGSIFWCFIIKIFNIGHIILY